MLINVVFAVSLLLLVGLARYVSYRGKIELASIDEDLKAFDRLVEWRKTHQDVKRIGDHPGGAILVQEAIVARKRFLKLFPFVTDKASLPWLYGML